MKIFSGKNKELETSVLAAGGAVLSLLVIGTFAYHYLEHWTWIEALYFTVVTLATIGYGDLHPTSDFSRLFTVFFILFGVSVGVASITHIGSKYLARREEQLIQKRETENIKNQKSEN